MQLLLEKLSGLVLFRMDFPAVFMKPTRFWKKDRLFCALWLSIVIMMRMKSMFVFKLCVKNIKFPS